MIGKLGLPLLTIRTPKHQTIRTLGHHRSSLPSPKVEEEADHLKTSSPSPSIRREAIEAPPWTGSTNSIRGRRTAAASEGANSPSSVTLPTKLLERKRWAQQMSVVSTTNLRRRRRSQLIRMKTGSMDLGRVEVLLEEEDEAEAVSGSRLQPICHQCTPHSPTSPRSLLPILKNSRRQLRRMNQITATPILSARETVKTRP